MLMRFDPFRDLDRIAQELPGAAGRGVRTFPMDAYRQGDGVVLLFDLPGVDPTSIDLTVDQNVLTIRAEPRKIEVTGNGRQPAEPVTAGA